MLFCNSIIFFRLSKIKLFNQFYGNIFSVCFNSFALSEIFESFKTLICFIRLKMKNSNIILKEKLQKYQPYHQAKLIIIDTLQVKKYYLLIFHVLLFALSELFESFKALTCFSCFSVCFSKAFPKREQVNLACSAICF